SNGKADDKPDDKPGFAVVAVTRAGYAGHSVADDIKIFLSERLPRYMIPPEIRWLDHIPRCAGDVDHALVRAQLKPLASLQKTAPEYELERQMRALWCEALQVRSVHGGDDFFDCGGHSLTAIRLVSGIKKRFG